MFLVFNLIFRNISGSGIVEREKVERSYICFQICGKIYSEWIRFAYVPLFFSIGGAVVVCLYFPLKHAEILPGFLSGAFAYLAVGLVVTVLWICLDTINVSKASDSIRYKLQSKPSSRLQVDEWRQKTALKRAKALCPLAVPVGNFGTMSLNVPVVFVEEILNQLLLLLTL